MLPIVEICCGSYQDGLTAYKAGAKRIELNSALYLGGLTPSVDSLDLLKKTTDLIIIAMVRCRGAGFCYSEAEYEQMFAEARTLLAHGADGLAFGFLNDDHTLDLNHMKAMVDLIHEFHATAVCHRAFDCCDDLDHAIQQLIDIGVDRVLTSGGQMTAVKGQETIASLVARYGQHIEILPGAGINSENVQSLIEYTHVNQVHASCKSYRHDPTTQGQYVTYGYYQSPNHENYESVDFNNVKALLKEIARTKL